MLRFDHLVWAVPLVVALATIWRPRLGFVLFAACLVFFGSPPGGPYLAALDVAAVALLVLSILRRANRSVSAPWSSAAFVLVSLASLIPPAYHPPAWSPRVLLGLIRAFPDVESWSALYTWRAAATMLLGWLLFIAMRRTLQIDGVRRLGLGLGIGVAIACVFGLLDQLQLVDLDGYRAVGELVPAVRMHSLFFNSGWFAEFLVLATPFAISALVAVRWRRVAVVLAGLATVCVVLSQQRGAWIAVLSIIGWVFWREREKLWRSGGARTAIGIAILLSCLSLGAVIALRPPVRHTLAQRAEVATDGLAGRIHLWHAALRLSEARPILGQGLGSFAPAYDRLYPPDSPEARRPRGTAHNWLLDVLAERGLLGVLALIGFAAVIVIRLSHAVRSEITEERTLGLGLAASFLGAVVYGVVQYLPFLKSLEWLLWLLAGAAFCLGPELPTGRLRRFSQALCVAALVVVPVRALVLDAPHWRGDGEYGLHEPESSGGKPFQWAGPDAALRLPWRGNCLQLRLANGHPKPERFPVTVRLTAGKVRQVVQLADGWEVIDLPVGPKDSATLAVRMSSDHASRPFADFRREGMKPSSDIRLLSVAMRPPAWVDCPNP